MLIVCDLWFTNDKIQFRNESTLYLFEIRYFNFTHRVSQIYLHINMSYAIKFGIQNLFDSSIKQQKPK